MRILIAGATGVIGRALTPALVGRGDEVTALVRPDGTHGRAESLGARSVAGDLLDRDSVLRAVRETRPDAVVHMATAIPPNVGPRRISTAFAATNRLRTEGMRNLVDAAAAGGVTRVVSQSVAFAYEPGDGLADEDTPLLLRPPADFGLVLGALVQSERLTLNAGGVALRFGHLYGPGSSFAADGATPRLIGAGRLPVVGGGTAVFSFVHAADAAAAVVAALDRPEVSGVLNVVDDDPATAEVWESELASLLHARQPKSMPTWLARPLLGAWGVTFFTALRGASNGRAKEIGRRVSLHGARASPESYAPHRRRRHRA
jgi:nucleoside-diphosphate-sugar epimerase